MKLRRWVYMYTMATLMIKDVLAIDVLPVDLFSCQSQEEIVIQEININIMEWKYVFVVVSHSIRMKGSGRMVFQAAMVIFSNRDEIDDPSLVGVPAR